MAAGRTASAYVPHLVGEQGPELFVPGVTGSIVPNYALASAGAPSAFPGATTDTEQAGGNTYNFYNTFTQANVDAHQVAREMAWLMRTTTV